MIEQEIARPVAQPDVQRRPRQLLADRRVEQLLDPGRIQVFRRAVPRVAQRPDAARRPARPRRRIGAHGDLARASRRPRASRATCLRRATRPRRPRSTAVRRAARAIGWRRCRRARSAKARLRSAFPLRQRRAGARPAMARAARAARRVLRRRRTSLARENPPSRQGGRATHLSARLSWQRASVLESMEPPCIPPPQQDDYCESSGGIMVEPELTSTAAARTISCR